MPLKVRRLGFGYCGGFSSYSGICLYIVSLNSTLHNPYPETHISRAARVHKTIIMLQDKKFGPGTTVYWKVQSSAPLQKLMSSPVAWTHCVPCGGKMGCEGFGNFEWVLQGAVYSLLRRFSLRAKHSLL